SSVSPFFPSCAVLEGRQGMGLLYPLCDTHHVTSPGSPRESSVPGLMGANDAGRSRAMRSLLFHEALGARDMSVLRVQVIGTGREVLHVQCMGAVPKCHGHHKPAVHVKDARNGGLLAFISDVQLLPGRIGVECRRIGVLCG